MMDKNFKSFFIKILEIIEYKEDKDKFINSFYRVIIENSFQNLISRLSEDEQKAFSDKIEGCSEKEIDKLVKEYFSKEDIKTEVMAVTFAFVDLYLEDLIPILTDEQIDQIDKCLASFKNTTNH